MIAVAVALGGVAGSQLIVPKLFGGGDDPAGSEAALGHAAAGHEKKENTSYRTLLVLHGLGALIALTGGFGLVARTGVAQGGAFPGWVWAKLVLWLLLGGMVALPYRSRPLARSLLVALPFLGLLGAYLANMKPV